ncbi:MULTISPECIES: hypothetical protein [unclassified Streptomyces]|uniref:hypothetical protein n=1 Tax=Streptomyces TaxID=1883 RepID=UPI000AAEB106|nr:MULTISPECIES: hypothetical protein [unclassified Streptomyces]WTC69722.1 hypothetical protein OG882_04990 [Streptomyces anulatus]WTF65682.1 hypothetical protein OH791_33660 [Streptomyces anulatus]
MFGRKTDRQCAQAAVAAAIVTGTQSGTKQVITESLTREEMARAKAYLESGQPITGK